MTSQEKFFEELTYRLILMLQGSRRILILETGSTHCFPSVPILKGTGIARELQRAVQDTWKLDVIVLDLPKPVCADNILYAVAEVRLSKRPFGLRAIDIAELRGVGLNKKLRGRLVSVSEGDAFPESSFSRIGWIDQSIDWVETETGKPASWLSMLFARHCWINRNATQRHAPRSPRTKIPAHWRKRRDEGGVPGLLSFTSWAATQAAQALRGGSTQRAGRSVLRYAR